MEDEHIYKSYNKSLLLYHLVFPAKYRRKIFTESVENTLKEICVGISERYEIRFIEIGVDEDHVHFLVQSVPTMSVTQLVKAIKSITARQLFQMHPEIKKILWGGNIWTSGYYANTVGQYASREVIEKYVAGQGKYKKIYESQLVLDTVFPTHVGVQISQILSMFFLLPGAFAPFCFFKSTRRFRCRP